MDEMNVLFSGFLLTSAVITFITSLYLLVSKKSDLSKTFAALSLCITFYTFGYGMELNTAEMEHMLFWNLIQHAGIPFIPTFWLILALRYTNPGKYEKRLYVFILFLIPAVTFLLRYTNEIHHLYYSFVYYVIEKPFPELYIEKGPWYVVQSLYATFAFLAANALYVIKGIRSTGTIRKLSLLMFLASLLPCLAVLMNLFGLSTNGLDHIPFVISVSFILILYVLYRNKFLDLKPLARDKVFQTSDSGIIVLDPTYNVVDFNIRAADVIPELRTGSFSTGRIESLEAESLMSEIREPTGKPIRVNRDGKETYYNCSSMAITDRNESVLGYTVTITDVTQYVEALKQLDYIASIDDLTSLFNRRVFEERANYELEKARRYKHAISVVILDLDFFKNINDEYGHQAGDAVLKSVADTCRDRLRTTDIIGRMGGEEFLICLPETDPAGALLTAERIREGIEALETPYENHRIKITTSIGVTGTDCVTEETLNSFLKSADLALYAAKADGRNCVREEALRIIC